MAHYHVIELLVPEEDIMEQEHWYYDKRLTHKAAIEWFKQQCKDYDIEVPEKYLLRRLTFTNSGRLCSSLCKDYVRTID